MENFDYNVFLKIPKYGFKVPDDIKTLNSKKIVKEFVERHFAEVLLQKGFLPRKNGLEWYKAVYGGKILQYIIFYVYRDDFDIVFAANPMCAYLGFGVRGINIYDVEGANAAKLYLSSVGLPFQWEYCQYPLSWGEEMYKWKLQRISAQLFKFALPILERINSYDDIDYFLEKRILRQPNSYAIIKFLTGNIEKFKKECSYIVKSGGREQIIEFMASYGIYEDTDMSECIHKNFLWNKKKEVAVLDAFQKGDLSIYKDFLDKCEKCNIAYMKRICKGLFD